MRIKKFTIRFFHRGTIMSGSNKSFDLSEEERKVLLARHADGFPPAPGMLDQHFMLVREFALNTAQQLDFASSAVDNISEPETLGYSVVGGQSSRAGPDGAMTTVAPTEPQPSTSAAVDPTSSEGLAQRWEELAPQLDEVFEWRRETEEREDELFADFEALLRDAGTRGRNLTDDHRRMMEATKEVRRRGGDALERRRAAQEALKEELEALNEARLHQERSLAKAKEIQARLNAARQKRFDAEGYRGPDRKCPVCGLPGVYRGRDCPNKAHHKRR